MDAHDKARLALRLSTDRHRFDGAWWPRSRVLNDELLPLFAAWPIEAGYISRIIYSLRDWDDRPANVDIPHRRGRVKTGVLPTDDAHQLVLMMLDGQRRLLVVIPPNAPAETAAKYLGAFAPVGGPTPNASVPSGPS